jgi:hypothetical protein
MKVRREKERDPPHNLPPISAPASHAHTCVVFEDLVGAEVVFHAVYTLIR